MRRRSLRTSQGGSSASLALNAPACASFRAHSGGRCARTQARDAGHLRSASPNLARLPFRDDGAGSRAFRGDGRATQLSRRVYPSSPMSRARGSRTSRQPILSTGADTCAAQFASLMGPGTRARCRAAADRSGPGNTLKTLARQTLPVSAEIRYWPRCHIPWNGYPADTLRAAPSQDLARRSAGDLGSAPFGAQALPRGAPHLSVREQALLGGASRPRGARRIREHRAAGQGYQIAEEGSRGLVLAAFVAASSSSPRMRCGQTCSSGTMARVRRRTPAGVALLKELDTLGI